MKFHHLLLGAVAAIAFSATVSAADSKDVLYDGVDLEPSGNPIFTDAWTCDPAPLVVGDRLYVYTGEDIYKDGENIGLPGNYNIADWRVYSTTDMVHWRSHGIKLRPEDFPDGKKGIAWAAQCIHKGDKFYWYVTYNTPQGGQCVGVAIGDTPVGPFVPHPKPLVVDSDTPGRGWNDIDPTVLIDDDGTAWLAWGQNSYIAKLKDNMTESDGEITDLHLQSYIEGPWLYKRKGLYYNIYAGFGGGFGGGRPGGNRPAGVAWDATSGVKDDWWKYLTEYYAKAAEDAAKFGCKVGLHNHAWEFQMKLSDGTTVWDYFFKNTPANVCMQQDVGWTTSAGYDPCEQYVKYPHRSPSLHAKENGCLYAPDYKREWADNFDAILGKPGTFKDGRKVQGVDWDRLFKASDADGVKWYVVECEKHEDSLMAIDASFKFLKSKGRC